MNKLIYLYGVSQAGKTPTLGQLIRKLNATGIYRLIDCVSYDNSPVEIENICTDKLAVFLNDQTGITICIGTKGDGDREIDDNINWFEQTHIDRKTGRSLLCDIAISACHKKHNTKNKLDDFAEKYSIVPIQFEKITKGDFKEAEKDTIKIVKEIIKVLD